jgi:hypothetical protein
MTASEERRQDQAFSALRAAKAAEARAAQVPAVAAEQWPLG